MRQLTARAVVLGMGLGLCMQTLVLSVQNVVPPKDMGVATSSATFFRSIGGTVGTAVFLSLLFTVVIDRLAGFGGGRGGGGSARPRRRCRTGRRPWPG